jgi:hypothetical protein
VATHADRQPPNTNVVDGAGIIPDIDMEDDMEDDEVRDMDIDDIPGLEDMQMPSDDESDDETDRKMYPPSTIQAFSPGVLMKGGILLFEREHTIYMLLSTSIGVVHVFGYSDTLP